MDRDIITYRPAWLSYWKGWLAIAVIGSVAWFTGTIRDEIFDLQSWLKSGGVLLTLVPMLAILIGIIFHRYTRSYEIEDGRRVRNTTGLIARRRREFLISDKIQSDLSQTLIGRLLGYGDLRFWTGDDQSGFVWFNVPAPATREAEVKSLAMSPRSTALKQDDDKLKRAQLGPESVISTSSPLVDSPPSGARFADYVIVLPPLPYFVEQVSSEADPIPTSWEFVERGAPLLSVAIPTENRLGRAARFESVIIPSPVSGLVVRRSHHNAPTTKEIDPANDMLTTILPVENSPAVDTGSVLFGELRNMLWTHREYLFRKQKNVQRIISSVPFLELQSDEGLKAALDAFCNQDCYLLNARPDFEDYINEAWLKRPHLRASLHHMVDRESLLRTKHEFGFEGIREAEIAEAIVAHKATLDRLAKND